MPISFVFAIIFGVVGIIALIVTLFSSNKFGTGATAVIAFVLFGLFTVIASANSVPVRNVGIETSFGRPTGETTGSGLHWVAPWKEINDWDASIQTEDHTGDRCITVRIGSMATACVDTKVRWQVKPEAAPEQYMSYKGDFANMRANLFNTELQNAMNEAFATYNPLANINISTGQVGFDGTALAKKVSDLLVARVGKQINVESVVIPLVRHDAKTEENIKAFQDVIAQSRILAQKQANAQIEKATAETLQNLPPQYIINKCLDLAKDLGKEPGLCIGGTSPIWTANK